MKIFVSNQQKSLPILVASVKRVVNEVIENESVLTDEVSVNFITSQEICHLHQAFFNDHSVTDCISFPLDGLLQKGSLYHVLGEVFICPQTAVDYNPKAPYKEVTLYLVHGLLHLLGHDDIQVSNRKKMRLAEKWHMKHLVQKNLLIKGNSRLYT